MHTFALQKYYFFLTYARLCIFLYKKKSGPEATLPFLSDVCTFSGAFSPSEECTQLEASRAVGVRESR